MGEFPLIPPAMLRTPVGVLQFNSFLILSTQTQHGIPQYRAQSYKTALHFRGQFLLGKIHTYIHVCVYICVYILPL